MSAKINISCSSNLHLYNESDEHQADFPASRRLAFTNYIAKPIRSLISSRGKASIQNPSPRPTTGRTTTVKASYMGPSEEGTFYEILGISENGTTLSDIKKAYKQMARIYHPDVSPPGSDQEKYTQKFIEVKEAYETLSDSQSKSVYDLNLASARPRSGSDEESWKEEGRLRWQSQLEDLKRRRRRTTAKHSTPL